MKHNYDMFSIDFNNTFIVLTLVFYLDFSHTGCSVIYTFLCS